MVRSVRLAAISATGLVVLGLIAFVSYRRHVDEAALRAHGELVTIGRVHAENVRAWRQARLDDARMVAAIPGLVDEERSRQHALEVAARFERVLARHGHRSLMILGPNDAAPEGEGLASLVGAARAGAAPALSPPSRDPLGGVHVFAVAPIVTRDDQVSGHVVVLESDPPEGLVWPLQQGPTPSAGVAVQLVRLVGDRIVSSDDGRRGDDTPMPRPLDAAQSAATWVARRSDAGPADRFDRDGEVLAVTIPVPDSDWAVVAAIDSSALFAPIRQVLAGTWLAFGAVFAAATAVALWQIARRDATARHHIASARESEERLALAVRASSVGLWDWDVASGSMYFSPEYEAQLGYAAGELPATFAEWADRLHPDDRERAVAYVQRYVASPWPDYSQEFRLRHRDASYRHILARAEGRFEEGRLVRMIGCHVDLTPIKALEAQYRQAQKMEAIGRLAGGVAHDFNNLLTVINGYVALLRSSPVALDVDRDLAEIQRAGESAARLTRHLLVFSRRATSSPTVIDVNTLLGDWHKLLRRTLGEDVSVELVLSPGTAHVLVDESQIEQALMNLAVNARDAMPSGGRLAIRTSRRQAADASHGCATVLPAGEYWVIDVEDSGTGIADEVLPHIFEPFFTTKELGKGTGLGLAMVYGVATGAGGTVCVRTSPRGTTFSIWLPVASDALFARRVGAKPAAVPRERRVLVVDDDLAVRDVVERMLSGAGYRVVGCDAASALQKGVTRDAFDVLLTDIVMPHLTGPELVDRLASRGVVLPVVYMTGYLDPHLADTLPPDATLLRKPLSRQAVVDAIERATAVVPLFRPAG
jgi:PAS domain S-box-containing protein